MDVADAATADRAGTRRSPAVQPRHDGMGLLVAGLAVCCSAFLAAQVTFRTRTDLVQLDVSALDGDRRPVTGLSAADFTVLDEGQPRPVETFVEVQLPPKTAVTATWQRDVSLDVITNEVEPKRIVIIVIDDYSLLGSGLSARAMTAVREIGRRAVDALRPGDRAALLFSRDQRRGQPLTADSQLLRNGIDRTPLFPTGAGGTPPLQSGECWCGLCMIDVLQDAIDALRTVEGVRKTVIHISAGMVPPGVPCREPYLEKFQAALDSAQAANVTVNSFDPREFNSGPLGQAAERLRVDPSIDLRREFLRNWSATTGGRAVVNSNDPDLKVEEVLAETGSYYLLGIPAAAPRPDGKPRRLEVRVNRRGVQVRSRHSYQPVAVSQPSPVPSATPLPVSDVPAASDGAAAASAARVVAITDPLLPTADFPLQVNVAPFAGPNGTSFVAAVVALTHPGEGPGSELDSVDVVIRAARYSGEVVGTQTLSMKLPPRLTATESGRSFEVFQKIPLPAGSYELRIGVQTADRRAASVYTHVAVPDFQRQPLSASGLVLSAVPSPPSGPKNAYADLAPVSPTTRRGYRAGDQITAFLRVYQRAGGNVPPATAQSQILDASGAKMLEQATPLEPVTFAGLHAADYSFHVPVDRLAPGEYVLRVTVRAGREQVDRAVRFSTNATAPHRP